MYIKIDCRNQVHKLLHLRPLSHADKRHRFSCISCLLYSSPQHNKVLKENPKAWDITLTIADLENALFTRSIGKSPGNDGLSVEFYKLFWDDIKFVLFDSFKYSRVVGELSASQRQAIIKLIEKRDKDK